MGELGEEDGEKRQLLNLPKASRKIVDLLEYALPPNREAASDPSCHIHFKEEVEEVRGFKRSSEESNSHPNGEPLPLKLRI